MYEYREAETAPSGPCARRSPNSSMLCGCGRLVAHVGVGKAKCGERARDNSSPWQEHGWPSHPRDVLCVVLTSLFLSLARS